MIVGRMGVLLGLLLALSVGEGVADEIEVEKALEFWAVDPLDLRLAEPDEIVLLPWLTEEEAASIAALARSGRLENLEDLLLVPGVVEAQLRALAPFVLPRFRIRRSPSERGLPPAQWELRHETRTKPDQNPWGNSILRSTSSVWEVGMREDLSRERRPGFAVAKVGAWSLGVGRLRPQSSSPLLLSDITQRSRSALLSFSLAARPRAIPTLSFASHEQAVSASFDTETAKGVIYENPQGEVRRWVEGVWRSGQSSYGVAWARLADGQVQSLVTVRRERGGLQTRLDLAGNGDGARVFAQLRWRHAAWKFGASATQAETATLSARDPISMARLDRPHRGWQWEVRHAGEQVSWRLFARRLRRGANPRASGVHRVRLWVDPRRPDPQALRWHLRLGVDERGRDLDVGEERSEIDLDFYFRVEERRSRWQRRARLWWRGQRGASSRAMALDLERQGSFRWRATLAAAAGTRSQPWAAGLVGGGLRVRWLRPGETLALLSFGRRREGPGWSVHWGAWAALAWSASASADYEGGWVLRLSRRSGAKVAAASLE